MAQLKEAIKDLAGFSFRGLTIEMVRSVVWGRSYLWNVEMVDQKPPSPFDKFLPVVDVEEPVYGIDDHPVDTPTFTMSVPKSETAEQLTLTMFDDIHHTMEAYFSEWINQKVTNKKAGLTALSSCVRRIIVQRLDEKRDVTKSATYLVYPNGSLNFHGDSESSGVQHTIQFVVVGQE